MNRRKMGKLFIVLMISLVAFGFGSCANAINSGNDITNGIIPLLFAMNNPEQISTIGDASFEPVRAIRHYNNTTNTTNTTNIINNTTNSTKPTNDTKKSN